MKPLVYVYYHGDVTIAYWEFLLAFAYILVAYLYFGRQKNIHFKTAPEYRYYLWGFLAKLAGGLAFSLIYFYYYAGGDTISYFFSGVAMRNMAFTDPAEYFREMFGDNTMRAWSMYTMEMGRPYQYVFFDERTFQVVRVASVLAILTYKSYLVSTMIIASLSFFGIWACYRTFVSYFPQLSNKLAIAFLFMPSTLFWGSSIMKDTFTFSAACLWVHAVDEVFFKRRDQIWKSVVLVLCGLVMVMTKPYVFMVLLPATLLWLFYFRVSRIRSILVKFFIVPLMGLALVSLSIFALGQMSDELDKFALDEALQTIQVTQGDLMNQETYGANSFNVGTFDGTWIGVLKKFPVATIAALFRPFVWEAGTFTMMVSALENLWVLGLTLLVLWRAGPFYFFRCIGSNPLLLMSMTFALIFAFTVGVTTPNFGALVRFKIPMIPFYISGLFIIDYLVKLKKDAQRRGRVFDLARYRMGTSGAAISGIHGAGRRSRPVRSSGSGHARGNIRNVPVG